MNVVAKKSLGQIFLIDEKILNLIVGLGNINSNDIVLEVGPGTGNLTEKILKKGPKKIIVVEKDANLSMNLKKKFNKDIIVINDDILNYNQSYLYKKKIIIFGNLPYNISTQILISWIKINNLNNFCKKFILMFQKEVADRILAEFNNKNYGRISIISSWKMEIEKIIDMIQIVFFRVLKLKVLCLFSNLKINFIKLKTLRIWNI